MSHIHNSQVIPLTGAIDNNMLQNYLNLIQGENKESEFGVCQFAHGITAVVSAYAGGVYSPTQNRIYLVPHGQSNQTNWHYIDCATGTVTAVSYTHLTLPTKRIV